MRPKNDFAYEDYKIRVEDAFHLLEEEEVHGAYDVSEWLFGQIAEYEDSFTEFTVLFFIISVAEYEVRHGILEERIRNGAAYHIYRYENMGRYKNDLTTKEIELIEKDMAYIKSKVELPELESYEDKDYN